MKNQKQQRKRARQRRNLPQRINQILSEHFPGLLSPDIKITHRPETGIVSFESENGLPWDDVEALIEARINSRKNNKKEAINYG